MTDSAPARPPQVTMAGWVTILGSAAVVLTVFDLIANLRSLDTRERVQKALSEPPLDGMGIDTQQVLSVMHVLAMVAAGCATAAAILGWHVLRRNKQARLWLTVLAVPLFFAGLVTGGFLSSMVAVAVVMLWTRPARDWFDGRAPSPALDGGLRERQDPDQSAPPPPPSTPTPYRGFGSQGGAPTGTPTGTQPNPQDQPAGPTYPPAPGGWPAAQQPPAQQQAGVPFVTSRPREVLQACVITWVFSGVVVLAMALVLVSFAADPSLIDDVYSSDSRFAESGLTADQIRSYSLGLALVFGLWALAAAAIAVLVFLGRRWARYVLIASSVMASLLTLVMVVAAPVLLLVTAAGVATAVLLTRPAVGAWFAQRTGPTP
ncbi:MAG: hypothetical protein ABWX84_13130 [Nocardioides sp.]